MRTRSGVYRGQYKRPKVLTLEGDIKDTPSRMFKRNQDERNLYILKVRGTEDMGTNSDYWRTRPDRFRNPEDNRSGQRTNGPTEQTLYKDRGHHLDRS
jgi:hypothetical protein